MGRSVPFVAPSWDERLQILQIPDYVALNDEFGELRLIPLGAPESRPPFRQWTGFSRGRWDGDTLVIETTGLEFPYWKLRDEALPAVDGRVTGARRVEGGRTSVGSSRCGRGRRRT